MTLQVYDSNMKVMHIATSGAGTEDDPASISTAGGGEVVFPASMTVDGAVSVLGEVATTDHLKDYSTIDSQLRVGSTHTIMDYKQLGAKDTVLFNEQLGGAATSVFDPATGGVKMEVFGAGDYVIRETKMTHQYTSGNPQIFEQTMIDMTPVVGVVKQVGYYSSISVAPYESPLNGLVLETNDTEVLVKMYRQGVVTFSAAQSTWDDPLDGSGASGLIYNPAAFEAFIGEFLYLGGTVFRAGFLIGPRVVWFHTFENSNVRFATMIGSPVQPLRWSIRSTGGAATLYHVCGKVGTIGEVNAKGISRYISNGIDHINANVIGVGYLLLAVRPNTRHVTMQVPRIGGLSATPDHFLIELILNPVIAGVTTWVDSGYGYDVLIGLADGSNTITLGDGSRLAGKYIAENGSDAVPTDNLLRAGCTIDGVYDTVVLCATPLGANLDVLGDMQITIQP